MIWSKYQNEIFDTYLKSKTNICVSAKPGSAKTTTLLQLLKLKPMINEAIFLSFSNNIVDELKSRIPGDIKSSTIHSVGYNSIMRHYDGCTWVDEDKFFKLAIAKSKKWDFDESMSKKAQIRYCALVGELVQKIQLHDIKDSDELFWWATENEEDISIDEQRCQHAWEVHEYALKQSEQYRPNKTKKLAVHFTEMVYWPATRTDILIRKYDEVFIDESQDTSEVQQKLIWRMVRKGGRFIACGDPYQTIYTFLGASVTSFENFQNQNNTVTLNLPISYRLPKVGIDNANKIFANSMQYWDKAIEGEIGNKSISEAQDGDFILCRNNKPLFEAYIYLLSNGVKSFMKDEKLGKALVSMIEPLVGMDFQAGYESLYITLYELGDKLIKKGVSRPEFNEGYIKMQEKIGIIEQLAKNFTDFRVIYELLDRMFFKDEGKGVALMTYHKSKGLEADYVFIIRKALCPSKRATNDKALLQELKVKFVAETRFKKALYYDDNF